MKKLKRISEQSRDLNKHLLLERKATIFIRVKEFHQAVSFGLGSGEVALISEVVEHFERADKGVAISVKSLESGVGREVAD